MLKILISNISNTNAHLVYALSEIITENEINSEEELKEFEDKIFTINGKILQNEERVEYVEKLYKLSPSECIDLSFDELMLKTGYVKQLKYTTSNEEKIKIYILLFDLLGKEMYFPYEAYKLIKNKEI